jgi:2-iminobutanoate/2-iminopropanoate deaminase
LRSLFTNRSPAPFGHYSQAVEHGDVIYVSGQLPANTDGSHGFDQSFEAQVRQALKNLLEIVCAGGGSLTTVVKVTAYIVGVEHWPAFNGIYADIFGECRPARCVVPVPALHHGYLVELEAIAVRRVRA